MPSWACHKARLLPLPAAGGAQPCVLAAVIALACVVGHAYAQRPQRPSKPTREEHAHRSRWSGAPGGQAGISIDAVAHSPTSYGHQQSTRRRSTLINERRAATLPDGSSARQGNKRVTAAASLPHVHVAFACRGSSFSPVAKALRVARGIMAWSVSPERFRFHLLTSGMHETKASAVALDPTLLQQVNIVNTSDAALAQTLSADGNAWLRLGHDGFWRGLKAHAFVVLKFFLHELLPEVDAALVLDTDVLVLDDVCALWDDFTARLSEDDALTMSYAREQQNEYRNPKFYTLMLKRAPPAAVRERPPFYNGGVALFSLRRMRQGRSPYRSWLAATYAQLQAVHKEASGLRSRDDRRLLDTFLKLSDQTMLAMLAALHPLRWKRFFRDLPCEWNWQLSLYFYTKRYAYASEPRGTSFNAVDSTCSEPPRILHFNAAGRWKDAQARADLTGRDQVTLRSNLRLLAWALSDPTKAGSAAGAATPSKELVDTNLPSVQCRAAEQNVPGIVARSCNETFLLQRLSNLGRRVAMGMADHTRERKLTASLQPTGI